MKPIYSTPRITVSVFIVLAIPMYLCADDSPPTRDAYNQALERARLVTTQIERIHADDSVSTENSANNAMEQARFIKSRIERKEQEVVQDEEAIFQAIEQAIAKMPTEPFQAQQETLDGFRQASRLLASLAHNLLATSGKIVTNTNELNLLNQGAVPIFRQTANIFQKYALEEPYADIKRDYGTLADTWSAIADLMEQRASRFADENKKLAETVRYIQRTVVFLDRFQEHLDSIPNIKILADRDRYFEQMKRYIRGFEQFRQLFRNFDAELRSSAMAANLRPTGSPPHPADIVDKGPRFARQAAPTGPTSNAKAIGTPAQSTNKAQMRNGTVLSRPAITSTAAVSCIVGLAAIPLYRRRRAKRAAKAVRTDFIPKAVAPSLDPPELPREPSEPSPPPKPKSTFVFQNTSFVVRSAISKCPDWLRI